MKIMIKRLDTFKLQHVTLAINVEDKVITIVACAKRKDGSIEIFHQDKFSTPE